MATGTDLRSTPAFLGIGAQKAGTTWLATNLRKHPDIWMPPRKELHYFDRSPEYPSPSYLYSENPLRRLFGTGKHNARSRREMNRALLSSIRRLDWQRLAWNTRYYLGRYDDAWYVSLFAAGAEKVSGEITPAYSVLQRRDVEKVHDLLPAAKILYLIRNPVDRAWSQLRFEANKKGWPLETLTLEKVREHTNKDSHDLRGDYIRTLSIWQSSFSREQFFVGFFDDIEQRPWELLKNIFDFLAVDATKYELSDSAFKKVNVSPEKTMPNNIHAYLASKYVDEVRQLNDLLGGHTQTWLHEIEQVLGNAGGMQS